jgi:hypothetical protein
MRRRAVITAGAAGVVGAARSSADQTAVTEPPIW